MGIEIVKEEASNREEVSIPTSSQEMKHLVGEEVVLGEEVEIKATIKRKEMKMRKLSMEKIQNILK